MNIDNN